MHPGSRHPEGPDPSTLLHDGRVNPATEPSFRTIAANERTIQRSGDIVGRFSFPFDGSFDLTQYAHGALLVHNDDSFEPLAGVDPHLHRNMEVVTWVVEGVLRHEDSAGHRGDLHSGMIQRMSAGTGIMHSERNTSRTDETRVVQMWVPPTTQGTSPSYAQADLNEALASGEIVRAVSGRPVLTSGTAPAITIDNTFVALDIARPKPGREIAFEAAPFHHVFVTHGRVRLTDGTHEADLGPGDAVRTSAAPELRVTALQDTSEILVWRMYAHF